MAEIEYLGRPATLYRYRSLAQFDQEVQALEDKYIWGSSFAKLNDPMEGSFRQSSKLGKAASRYSADVQLQIDNVGIGSFCEIGNHVLMWAHYADQFRGICIAYNLTELIRHMDGDVTFTRIAYSDSSARLTKVHSDTALVAKRILSRKTRAWLYEREWRMFSSTQGEQSYYARTCVRRVITGHKMEPSIRSKLKGRLRRLKIKIEELDKDDLAMSL